ncbi:beta,beta-carotene 15,15'-dioxygenase isoform X2 [Girardinichthys multiradiatus]|uniref:beta,beta-carotene 15,15'-dioxygenase isoform X2 n=1 Tax=Girardinichthys multiradiatus TaxID=208333 RepID=UPI001FAC937C|nr:beta,beta-carotene 15,15'-dioxygenase isoform X2 [Girardinichthys multiradiatus]
MDYSKNATERPEPFKAEVIGAIPNWLQGTLLRNGPGIFSVGETSYDHWFDGMSLLTSFSFSDGEMTHRSRFLRSDTYNTNMGENRIVVSEMGTMAYPDPSKNFIFKAITFLNHTVPDFTDNGSSNIIKYGDDYFATSETNYIRKIDPVTLETQDKVDYTKYLPVNLASSHPHYDKEGNAYNIGTSIAEKGKTKYILFKVPAVSANDKGKPVPVLKKVEAIATVSCRSLFTPSYCHSIGFTDNYIIFVEQPFKLDILKMTTAYMRGVNWASCLKFCPNENTLIHLIDKRTGKEVEMKYYTGSMVIYHHVNAFEDEGHVVFDVIAYKDDKLYDMFYLKNLKKDAGSDGSVYSQPSFKRFALPIKLDKGVGVGENVVKLKYTTASAVKEKEGKFTCHSEVLCEGFELPRINYDFNGKKYRFVYGNIVEEFAQSKQLAKFDTETKTMIFWEEENCWPSEPVFVPRPNGESEDDGVVLSSVINSNPGQSGFLVILDGRTFKEVARAYVNTELYKDMHGIFIPKGN